MFFESFLLNIAVIAVLLVALIFDYVTKFFSYFYIRHIPYKTPIPFFGSDLLRVLGLRSTTDTVNDLYTENPMEPFVGYIKSRIPHVIVKDPEYIKVMLQNESAHFNSRGLCLDKSKDVCLRNNIFYAEGEKWNFLRGNLESILKKVAERFQQNESSIAKYLQEVNGEVNVRIFLEKTMDCVFKDLLFNKLSPNDEAIFSKIRSEFQKRSLVTRVKSYLKVIFPSIYNGLGVSSVQMNVQQVQQLLRKSAIMAEADKMSPYCPQPKKSLAKSLHKNTEECDVALALFTSFMAEGYVPCLNVLVCLFYELSRNEQVQRKLKSLANNDDYLNSIIMETFRKYPRYSIINRKCTKTFKFEDTGLLFDRGVTVTVPVASIHHDAKYYPRPDEFDPDRFMNENKKTENAYLPYGIGHRKCIGAELSQMIVKAVTQSVVKKYKLTTCSKTPDNLNFVDHNFSRHLVDDICLRFTPKK